MKKIFALLFMTQVFLQALPAQFEAMRLDGSSAFLSFYDGATPKGLLWNNNGNMTLGTFGTTNPTGQIKFITNNLEQMVITSRGSIGIGTSTPSISARLDVRNDQRGIYAEGTNVIGIHGYSLHGNGVFGYSENAVGISGTSLNVAGLRGSSDNGIGVIGHGQTSDFCPEGPGLDMCIPSSLRWLKNIRTIPNPLEKIAAIRGVYFDCDEEHGGQHDVGFIAEEVGKVLPEIVGYDDNGVDAIGMDYAKMTPLLVEAVNAMRSEYLQLIADLQDENRLLKAGMSRWRAEITNTRLSTKHSDRD